MSRLHRGMGGKQRTIPDQLLLLPVILTLSVAE
jgi:hypothetical protein